MGAGLYSLYVNGIIELVDQTVHYSIHHADCARVD